MGGVLRGYDLTEKAARRRIDKLSHLQNRDPYSYADLALNAPHF
jgi:hypothetical protein